MKTALILFLALMTVFASAMSIHRPFRKPVTHPVKTTHPVVTKQPVITTHPVETTRPVEKTNPVSWKTVAAGGAAAGTVVAAYKIGSGVEEGMATAAKEAPVAFLSSITLSSLFIPLIAVVGIPVVGFFIWQKLSS